MLVWEWMPFGWLSFTTKQLSGWGPVSICTSIEKQLISGSIFPSWAKGSSLPSTLWAHETETRDGCLNRSVTALRTLQITCFGELDVRDYATTEKIWESEVRETLWMEVFLAYFLVIWPVFSFFFFSFGVLCRPLLLLPSIFPSIRVFSNESALCIGWPKYWSFSFSISPSNEYSGLISFRIDSSVLESDYPG